MRKWITLGITCLLLPALMSCASKTRTLALNFSADPVINSKVLLPVDVILTEDPLVKKIVKIGPEEWFGHQFRETLLEDELYPLAVSGGEQRIKEYVLKEGVSKVIIYADFEEAIRRENQQLMLNCPKKKNKFEILIRENNLEIKP